MTLDVNNPWGTDWLLDKYVIKYGINNKATAKQMLFLIENLRRNSDKGKHSHKRTSTNKLPNARTPLEIRKLKCLYNKLSQIS